MPFPPLLEEHMKKTRILSLVLLLTLLLHCLLLPVFAEPESSAGEPSDPISESALCRKSQPRARRRPRKTR